MKGLLVDVGDTLVAQASWRVEEEVRRLQLERLRLAFGSEQPWFSDFVLRHHPNGEPPDWRQRTREAVEGFLAEHGVVLADSDFKRICQACTSRISDGIASLEPGATEALRAAKQLGLRLAICSDTFWQDDEACAQIWADLRLDDCFDAYVTSLDTGFCKPHPAMFQRALALIGISAHEAAMVGNSPERDIAGAKALGIRTIWKRPRDLSASCEPPPDVEITHLGELPPVLERWL